MILSHCRWTAMAVKNIVLRWQWTLMAAMILYKRTSELQRWWTTPAHMNLPFSMRICAPPENTQKVTPYVGDELSSSKKMPKKRLYIGDDVSFPRMPKRASSSVMKSPFFQPQKSLEQLLLKMPGSSFLAWPMVILSHVKMDPFQKSHRHAECMSPFHPERMCDSHPECTCL